MGIGILFGATILVMFAGYVYWSFHKMKNMPVMADHKNIKQLNDQNFNQQIKKGIVLVDFWASWCAPCKMMAPVLNDVADALSSGKSVGKVNVEVAKAASAKYNIRSIPTMVLFKDGKEINRYVGIKTKEFLLKEMNGMR
ncbi:MAG: thioredoxin [Prolixibacteraceae bacterium]|jgi:thioredoxin 1|nr:thioredoxin [Prolixibacteraceae bacterium]